jgi:hypothetical protein
MKSQPNRNYKSDDVVQTPPALAERLVAHFRPQGKVLEPCRGAGHIWQTLPADSFWCEIQEGRDFFQWQQSVDWIITNPPWSQIRPFLQHAMKLSDNVVFLLTINHLWTKARVRDVRDANFGMKEIVLIDMPRNFPQSGFQLGAVHLERGWRSGITITDWTEKVKQKQLLL